jgi:hypothetical protein
VGRERRIERLQLRARDPALVRRGAILVEDALRTATVPGEDGRRILIVRRIDLGRIDLAAPPSAVALAIERTLTTIRTRAVRAEDPGADAADAVTFVDEIAPLVEAARIVVGISRIATDAWFWRSIVPELSRQPIGSEALAAVLEAATRRPAALPTVLATMIEAGVAAPLFDALEILETSTPGALAFARLDLEAVAHEGPVPATTTRARQVLAAAVARWSPRDRRALALATVAIVGDRHARLADPRVAIGARRLLAMIATVSSARAESGVEGSEVAVSAGARARPLDGDARRPRSEGPERLGRINQDLGLLGAEHVSRAAAKRIVSHDSASA